MRRAVVVLSGGQDSTTCLAWAKKKYEDVACVTFDYGQRHAREIDSAKAVARLFGIFSHEIIRVPEILRGSSPLIDRKSELEQYPDWQNLPGGLEKTFVPMRNQFFLTVAANRAIAWGANTLVTGVCQEDFGGYPDCRRIFIDHLENAINYGSYLDPDEEEYSFLILTPLMYQSKSDSVRLAIDLGAYGALGFSHTAYDGAYPPVGKDHATLLRAKGFEQAGVPDPLIVRAYWEGLMPLPETYNYTSHAERIRNNAPWVLSQSKLPDIDWMVECLNKVIAQ